MLRKFGGVPVFFVDKGLHMISKSRFKCSIGQAYVIHAIVIICRDLGVVYNAPSLAGTL